MTETILVSEGPIRDLFLAINHYISTGDHIGEGVAIDEGDERQIVEVLTDNPAVYWLAAGRYWIDDATFGPVCAINTLVYDDDLGLSSPEWRDT